MSGFGERIEEILQENQRLHLRLEHTDTSGPVGMTEWYAFFIVREAGEIIRLVASVRLSVCLSVRLSVRQRSHT